MSFHIFDHFFERAGPAQSAGNVWMELKCRKHRPERRLFVKVVEKPFPQAQRILGVIAGAVLMAVKSAVAEWLARQFDQTGLLVFPNKREIVGKGVAVPDVAF